MVLLPTSVTSPRLVLRTWTVDDAAAINAAVTASVEHLRPWMPWIAHEPQSIADRCALVDQWDSDWRAGNGVTLGMLTRDGTVVGGTGFPRLVGDDGLEIGYWVHVDHVGRGYAQEAARALTDVAFTIDGIDVVEIHHDRANIASGRVPEALGYVLVDEHPREITAPAECGITCVWRTTRATWTGGGPAVSRRTS